MFSGAEVSCQPHLRDSFGNASAAPDEALAARLVAPDGEHTIALKRLNNAVGAHSLSYTPYVAGAYELHHYAEIVPRMEFGQPIQGHLFVFSRTQ